VGAGGLVGRRSPLVEAQEGGVVLGGGAGDERVVGGRDKEDRTLAEQEPLDLSRPTRLGCSQSIPAGERHTSLLR
jgi:hypothetical protein